MPSHSRFGQLIGGPVADWTSRPVPAATPMVGRTCRVEPLVPDHHAADLFAALAPFPEDWTYLSTDAPATPAIYQDRLAALAGQTDPSFYAILDGAGRARGIAAFLRIDPTNGTIEVGHIQFGRTIRRTAIGTEALALMMRRAFDDLGYRRFEWKCDSLNAPSRAAALRLGFTFEGIFRNALVTKGRNRDTAWFSMIDSEWPALRRAFERWLDPDNFDAAGQQRQPLAWFRESAVPTMMPPASPPSCGEG